MPPIAGKRAIIWEYFTKKVGIDSKAGCKSCSAKVGIKLSNTSGMRRHLEKNHNDKYKEYIKVKNTIFLIIPPEELLF